MPLNGFGIEFISCAVAKEPKLRPMHSIALVVSQSNSPSTPHIDLHSDRDSQHSLAMRRSFQVLTALSAAICSPSFLQTVSAAGEELCSLAPESYASTKSTYPKLATAISELEKYSIATWYSDRNGDYAATLSQLVKKCSTDTRLSIVVYGLPNKDCEAGYSAGGGTVKNAADYLTFLKGLTSAVGNRKALYVLEPDAVGLLAKENGCGATNGYSDNLKVAIKELSANPNAEIYLDIGYWTLEYPDSTTRVTTVVKELVKAGTIKGITINTSNYRSSKQLATLCTNFQQSMGSGITYNCIVDTSRNYNEPASTEWCNVRPAGIGHPPTSETGYSNLDYFMWVKPPGESDGTCNDGSHNADAMKGPDAGKFFEEAFTLLWNQGYFVKEGGMAEIGGSVFPTPASTTPAPVTTAPKTPAPGTTAPKTPAPGTKSPKTPTPSSPTSPSVKPTSPPATVRPYEPSPAPTAKTPEATPTKKPSPAPTAEPSSAPVPKPTKACRAVRFTVQIAKALGAHVTTTTSFRNAEFVKSLGADHAIDYTKEKWVDLLEPHSIDVIYDCGVEAGAWSDDAQKVFKKDTGRFMTLESIQSPIESPIGATFTNVVVQASAVDLKKLTQLTEARKIVPTIDSVYPFGDLLGAIMNVKSSRGADRVSGVSDNVVAIL